MPAEMTLNNFKKDLVELDSKQVICKNFLSGNSHLLSDHQYFELRDRIANKFEVEFNEVILVGSSKVGFSIAPKKRFRQFCDESDIDIAVISESLFTKVWKEAYTFKKSGAYWPKAPDFFKYLNCGWIRPDKLPTSDTFVFTSSWWDFFNELTSTQEYGPYKVRGGLYHSWFFFFHYQMKCVEQCVGALINENISN